MKHVEQYPYHIIRVTLKKSNTIINLLYNKDSGRLCGYLFDKEPAKFNTIIEVMKDVFPPEFDRVGEYNVKLHHKVDYFLISQDNQYKEIQNKLEINN